MTTTQSINQFLSQEKIAVAGVSRTRQKFGNAIYKELRKKGYQVFPVHPSMDDYQGQQCFHSLEELPEDVSALVINTKNDTTLQLIRDAKRKGIQHIWLQQGSVNKDAIGALQDSGLNIISRQCILMHAGEVKGMHAFHRWLKKSFGKFPD